MTIEDYILDRDLPSITKQQALTLLEKFLSPRIAAAELGQVSDSTIEEIIVQARARKNKRCVTSLPNKRNRCEGKHDYF